MRLCSSIERDICFLFVFRLVEVLTRPFRYESASETRHQRETTPNDELKKSKRDLNRFPPHHTYLFVFQIESK